MSVPLLLGEDFQTAYKFNIFRSDDGDHKVRIGESEHYIKASGSRQVELGFEIRKAFVADSISRKVMGQRAMARRKYLDRLEAKEKGYVRAARDYTIPANSVYNIEVRADFEGRKEWLVEKVVLGQEDGSILAAPLTWISASDPRIPMANPSPVPRFIEEGEIVGLLKDPFKFLDIARTTREAEEQSKAAEVIKAIVQARLDQETMDHSSVKGDEFATEPSFGQNADSIQTGVSHSSPSYSASSTEERVQSARVEKEEGEEEDDAVLKTRSGRSSVASSLRSVTVEDEEEEREVDPGGYFVEGGTMEQIFAEESVAISSSPCQADEAESSPTKGVADSSPGRDDKEEEQWGPKTTVLPDDSSLGEEPIARLVNFGPDVPPNIKERLESVLRKNERAFGVGDRLGAADVRAPINLKEGARPISLPMYTASPLKREVIEKQVRAWVEADVIKPSVSPWGAPCVVVFRNGKARLAVDYWKLNTINDEFPIPRQSDILQALSGAQVLSSFDALAGFTQLRMTDEAKELTAFRSHLGLWQFKRMPFGLKNGPSIFQRFMQGVLAPFLWLFALVYLDDIVVSSKSWEEHINHLDQVLQAIAKAGVTLSPSKCYVGFNSILLLGQKVSRLGLSTHEEKVKAIMDLARPRNVHELQQFLGMVVYFSAYIPHYAFLASPLFQLLKKGNKWVWLAEHEIAFKEAKDALSRAPVLGHPIQGIPYRLYSDASDLAIGASLQQIQPIRIGDLKETPTYERLRKAYDSCLPVPTLVSGISKDYLKLECPTDTQWSEEFDDTIVYAERVIAYWSRTLKSAERNYSTTEREALGVKEALVKFQPFIEGEKVTLVTDHAALQWARVYENTNRRLAAWGAVFAAYPGLQIIHRPGRVHSNVDPLSRLPRVPDHLSPSRDYIPSITPSESSREKAEAAEFRESFRPAARAAFTVMWLEDLVEKEIAAVETRAQRQEQERLRRQDSVRNVPAHSSIPTEPKGQSNNKTGTSEADGSSSSERLTGKSSTPESDELGSEDESAEERPIGDNWTHPFNYDSLTAPQQPDDEDDAHLLIGMHPELLKKFQEGYLKDRAFKNYYVTEVANEAKPLTPSRFEKGGTGLLYFIDADWNYRLCIPESVIPEVLRRMHESAFESAHEGPERFYLRMRELFYWKEMPRDTREFARSCDICQKIKVDKRAKMGGLRPAHIPHRPFSTVSLDLITGLPPSGPLQFDAILVIVDKLTKYAIIIPTHGTMNQFEFADIFIERVVNVFGMPNRIIADHDKRWTSKFWRAVMDCYGGILNVSTSHHPQTDGQTEILNATIEQMLRAYVATDRTSWSRWLSELARAYNSAVHSSTGRSPNSLLFSYEPQITATSMLRDQGTPERPAYIGQKGEEWDACVKARREAARDALALAQERQARAYNKNRRPIQELRNGDLVLINPHTMELIEADGTGRKLVQRTIGPFEVMEKINPLVYRLRLPDNFPMHPVINLEHLKLYHPSDDRFGPRSLLPDTRELKIPTEEFEVEAILGHKDSKTKSGTRRKYLVRWKGFDPTEDSWVTETDLRNAPRLRREYLKTLVGISA